MGLFTVYPDQMQPIKCYKIYCIKCGKIKYSHNGECRYDYIKRLQKEGWVISMNNPSKSPVICPDCKETKDIERNTKIDRGLR